MSPAHDWAWALTLVVALGAAAAALGWLLRRCAVPGGVQSAAACAGVFIGLIAGPGLLARGWPDTYAALVSGGAREQALLTDLIAQQSGDITALAASGVTGEAIDELRARHAAERDIAREQLARAQSARSAWNDRALLACIAVSMLAAGALTTRRSATLVPMSPALSASLRAGLIILLIGVVTPAAAARTLVTTSTTEAVAFAFAIGLIGPAFWLPRLLRLAAVPGAIALGALALADPLWAFALLPVCLVPALIAATIVPERLLAPLRLHARTFLIALALPTLSALLAVRLDLHALDTSRLTLWAALVLALIWCSDGRMFAAWLGARSITGDRAWTRSVHLVNAGALVPQAAITGAAAATGVLGPETLTACVAALLFLSLTGGARRMLADMLDGRMRTDATRDTGE